MPTLPSFPGAVHRRVSLLGVATLFLRSVTGAGGVVSGFGCVVVLSLPPPHPTKSIPPIVNDKRRIRFIAQPSDSSFRLTHVNRANLRAASTTLSCVDNKYIACRTRILLASVFARVSLSGSGAVVG